MITQEMTRLQCTISDARDAMAACILAEMGALARSRHLTQMTITRSRTRYEIDGIKETVEGLDNIVRYYRCWVDSAGFAAHWTPEKGWD